MAGNLQNVSGVSKGLMMYGADGTGGLASSTNQLVNKIECVTCITWETSDVEPAAAYVTDKQRYLL